MKSYIRVDGWKANIRFSSAHVIPEYEKCGRLHGHSYAINAKIYGKKDEKGIILDFSHIKKILKDIADSLDHMILIPGKSKSIKIEEKDDQITIHSLDKKYMFPKIDCKILPISSTSAENLACYVLDELFAQIREENRINEIEIGVDEGFGQGAFVSKSFK